MRAGAVLVVSPRAERACDDARAAPSKTLPLTPTIFTKGDWPDYTSDAASKENLLIAVGRARVLDSKMPAEASLDRARVTLSPKR